MTEENARRVYRPHSWWKFWAGHRDFTSHYEAKHYAQEHLESHMLKGIELYTWDGVK
jgi:hypothetical protein